MLKSINLNIESLEAGLGAWEGFGLFLEADVADAQGNTFHYTGIPAYKRQGDQLIRLDRALFDLRKKKVVRCLGRGPDARWKKTG